MDLTKGYLKKTKQTIKLVLYDVVEDLQQKEDQMVVGGASIQEPRSAKCLKERFVKLDFKIIKLKVSEAKVKSEVYMTKV